MKKIYLDNAATTAVDERVIKKMKPYFDEIYGNPSSFHSAGKAGKDAIEEARERVARIFNCKTSEIIFTSSGTESDNLAILGVARKRNSGHIITTKIEHPAVTEPCEQLEKEGFRVSYVKVNKEGLISPEDVVAAIQLDTILVSVMYANNEVGTIQPIKEIVEAVKKENKNILVHTDACQAGGVLDLDVEELGVDLMTINGSKLYGPKGVGILYVRSGVKLQPLTFGGGQEQNLKPGTENVPAIVGFAEALDLSQKGKEKENKRLRELRNKLIKGILEGVERARLNGHAEKRLPNNVNVSFARVEGEAIVLYLDSKGVFAATGSACSSKSLEPSHVILALGESAEVAHSSIRFTLGKDTIEKDIDYLLDILPGIIKDLRKISAL